MREPNTEILMALLLDTLIGTSSEGPEGPELINPLRPRPAMRDELMAAIDISRGQAPLHGFRRRFSRLFQLSERESDGVLAQLGQPSSWLQLGSVLLHNFEPGPKLVGSHAGLVRCPAGAPFPTHRHIGPETTFFLSGTVRDDDTGEIFFPGDIISKPAESLHRLSVLPSQECIFAVLMEGGMPDFTPAFLE